MGAWLEIGSERDTSGLQRAAKSTTWLPISCRRSITGRLHAGSGLATLSIRRCNWHQVRFLWQQWPSPARNRDVRWPHHYFARGGIDARPRQHTTSNAVNADASPTTNPRQQADGAGAVQPHQRRNSRRVIRPGGAAQSEDAYRAVAGKSICSLFLGGGFVPSLDRPALAAPRSSQHPKRRTNEPRLAVPSCHGMIIG